MADEHSWIEAALAECPRAEFTARLRRELERRARMMIMAGVREGFTTVTPYLAVADVDRFVSFAREAFGAVETLRAPGGAGRTHCELRIGESMVMCGGGPEMQGSEKPQALHLYVLDVDSTYRRALEAGAESLAVPEDKPYGERMAALKDSAGNLWYPATRLAHAGPPEGIRTVVPYLHQQNSLGLIDFLKQAFNATPLGIFKSPQGQLMHGAVRIGDSVIEMGDAPRMPAVFYLYVPDADRLYEQALAAGAKSLSAPADQHYGDRVGAVEDDWGHTWYIATHLG